MITCVGPLAAMQFAGNRLPNLARLDAVPRPVYLQAAQGGTRTNSEGKKWFETRGVMVAADGAIHRSATGQALQTFARSCSRPRRASDRRQAALHTRRSASPRIAIQAFHADAPAPGIVSENTCTMHEPFLALMREGPRLTARSVWISCIRTPRKPTRRSRPCPIV